MASEFFIDILTPQRKVVDIKAEEAILPAYDGERGMLAEHAHFIGVLGTGVLRIRHAQQEDLRLVSGGVFEFCDDRLVILTDLLENPEEIDAGEAKRRVREIDAAFENHSQYDPEQGDELRAERVLNAAREIVGKR